MGIDDGLMMNRPNLGEIVGIGLNTWRTGI